jgi:hypothetical protein
MAPPLLELVLHEKKEEDSISKRWTESEQNKAPPLLVDVHPLNKQFETKTFVLEVDWTVVYFVVAKVCDGEDP